MKKLIIVLCVLSIVALYGSASGTTYSFSENWDGFNDGDSPAVGNWNTGSSGVLVSNTESVSAPNSVLQPTGSLNYEANDGLGGYNYSTSGIVSFDWKPTGAARMDLFLSDENGYVAKVQMGSYVRIYYTDTPDPEIINPANVVNFDQWNHAEITFDYTAGTIEVSINGTPIVWPSSGSSVRSFGLADGRTGTGIWRYRFIAYNDTLYSDNHSFTAIPEPASLSLVALALLMLRRRK